MPSGYQELKAKWALLANVGWQNWSQFGKVNVGVDSANPQSLTANANYKDTWHGALGAQSHASDRWQFSAGVAYDSSAVSDANRTLSAPMGQAYRIGLGAQYQASEKVNIGAAYEFLWAGDMPVSRIPFTAATCQLVPAFAREMAFRVRLRPRCGKTARWQHQHLPDPNGGGLLD